MEMKEQGNTADLERIYQNARVLYEGNLYSEAAKEFGRIPDYKDSAKMQAECEAMVETARLDKIYKEADKAAANMNVRSQEKAIRIFETIPGYRDADERIAQAKRRIEEIIQKEKDDREEAVRLAKLEEEKAVARRKRRIRAAGIAALTAALLLVGAFLFQKFAVPALRYQRGIKQMQAGDYDGAYKTLHKLNYQNSSDLITVIEKSRLKDAEIGSTVLFGAYPQKKITSKEADPIEWIVLDKDGSKLMLISKYCLDALPYMNIHYEWDHVPVSWRTSLVRDWLNGTFLKTAFDYGEINMLRRTSYRADAQTDEGMSAVEKMVLETMNDTEAGQTSGKNKQNSSSVTDRVFLLSVSEAEKYFATDEDRKCTATGFALGFGAYRSSIDYTCMWWLRTPVGSDSEDDVSGRTTYEAYSRIACVGTSGQIIYVGHDVLNAGYALRPVIWVDTEAAGSKIPG